MDSLAGLNPQQRQAVIARSGAVLVLAGPGSGKTRVLAHRIAYLVQQEGVSPRRIMAVTFTNKAAREMRDRVELLLGGRLGGLTIGTFHATCARILRLEADYLPNTADFVIYDTKDQESVAKQVLKKLNLDEKTYSPHTILNIIGRAKNELIIPEVFQATTYLEEIAGRAYHEYQTLLQENNAYDFDDLLMQVVLLFDEQPTVLERYQERYQQIMVDEFQDTNTAQYALVRRLAGDHNSLFCVGDEDQSIYLFRGADWRNVHRFRDDFPQCQTILLEQNYRSTQIVLDAAQAIIRRNPYRTHKALFTDRQGGAQIRLYEAYDEDDQADYVIRTIRRSAAAPGDYAIMYRTNAQSRRLEEAFIRAGMPYRLVGATRFYARREIRDVIAYLRLIHNPADSVSLLRIINVPPRGIGAKTMATLESWAMRENMTLAAALDRLASGEPGPFSGRAITALNRFTDLLTDWIARRETTPVAELIDLVLAQSGYRDSLQDGTRDSVDRWDNIVELRGVASEYPEMTLTEFLEGVALVSDVDNLTEEGSAPALLTLHAAKGLEFPIVFIVGVEDDILPHKRSWDDPEQMAEERRLFYVGVTRAMDELYLVYCFRRATWGDVAYNRRSRFLEDIPPDLLDGVSVPAPTPSRDADWSWSSGRSGALPTPAWQAEIRTPSTVPAYKTGQRVMHASFGEGIVIECQPADGDAIITVAFEDAGLKRLLSSMAKLEVL